ncbi:MAG: HAD family phosphatase [Candidatus Levybacteria bacterium]|nr:HAD family phosphatase [Candidatus Levybacteria bacterium]
MNKYVLLHGIRDVIFDLDGLLIDSEPLWQDARKLCFQRHALDFNAISPEEVMGAGVRDNILLYKKRLGLTGETETLVAEYRQTFYDLGLKEHELTLCQGAREFVTYLSEHGYQLAMATGGHTREMVEKILTSLELRKPFSLIVSSDEVSKGKPDPEVYIYTLKKLALSAGECVVFEDSVNGVKAGKGAGIYTVGVNRDERIRNALSGAGADIVLSNLREASSFF